MKRRGSGGRQKRGRPRWCDPPRMWPAGGTVPPSWAPAAAQRLFVAVGGADRRRHRGGGTSRALPSARVARGGGHVAAGRGEADEISMTSVGGHGGRAGAAYRWRREATRSRGRGMWRAAHSSYWRDRLCPKPSLTSSLPPPWNGAVAARPPTAVGGCPLAARHSGSTRTHTGGVSAGRHRPCGGGALPAPGWSRLTRVCPKGDGGGGWAVAAAATARPSPPSPSRHRPSPTTAALVFRPAREQPMGGTRGKHGGDGRPRQPRAAANAVPLA